MNGFLLLIPVLLMRYGVLYVVGKDAFKRAAFFPSLIGVEKVAYWIYQLSIVLIFLYLLFLTIVYESPVLFYAGAALYFVGIFLYMISILDYANPAETGMNLKGLYKISRNPMYMAFFIFLLGSALLTASFTLFALVIVFQISVHWIILSEERWCISKFGDDYIQYMKKVRRYI